ncbi:MAG: hypothetical protein EHM20_00335 [Alphaproteobacteria bacterium]|nr:MAG: hypothetical protein EHM20_00335 [Alphaproteobacteria bacterium]
MMAKKLSPSMRVDPKFKQAMENLMDFRLKNGLLNRKDAKFPKMTELLMRTEGYKVSENELKLKKEKKNE